LVNAMGEGGKVARVGGDEFACLLPNCDEATLRLWCAAIATAVDEENKALDEPTLSVALGYAVCKKSGGLDDALRRADSAMYSAKRAHYQS
jgi:GGDEF domain-containing protein